MEGGLGMEGGMGRGGLQEGLEILKRVQDGLGDED